jgi:hypothetical protein
MPLAALAGRSVDSEWVVIVSPSKLDMKVISL